MATARLRRRAASAEQVKQDGWREMGLLAVSIDDQRLSWLEREFIRQIGEKLYGKKREAEHG
jgi:hypothetical protein